MGRKEMKIKRLGLNTIPLTSISKIPSLSFKNPQSLLALQAFSPLSLAFLSTSF